MDVRCERCKTEYEFDDARITEAGVTVRCTTCQHVFMVKKKALVVTVPVKPGGGVEASPTPLTAAPSGSGGAPADKGREWRVRQASGNVFTFRELTTLQKWIVERKVTRDDEISLTGESWKRLGNIAELASFFQVVDEAQRATALPPQAPQPAAAPPPVPQAPPAPPQAAAPARMEPP
ncbi:MAG TPA: zinc-ribbon domain-containing protein, partial [Aggregicoccus sp.]|nr:zinc-ribbon domain-containing protein [Aggregicoccus sp.]